MNRNLSGKQRSLRLAQASNDGLRQRNTNVETHARNADRALVSQRELYEQRLNERASAVAKVHSELDPYQLSTLALETENREWGEKYAGQLAAATEQQQIAEDRLAQIASRDSELAERNSELAELRPLATAASTCQLIITNRLPELANRPLPEVLNTLLTESDIVRTDLEQTKELFKDRNDRIGKVNLIIARLFDLLRSVSRRDEPYASIQDLVEKLGGLFVGMPNYHNAPLLATETLRPRAEKNSVLPPRIEMIPIQRPQISLPTGGKREDTGSFRLDEALETVRDSWVEELVVRPGTPGYRRLKDSTQGANPTPGDNRPPTDEPTPSGVRCFPPVEESHPRIEEDVDDDKTHNKDR